MCDRSSADTSPSEDFEDSVRMIMQANGTSYEKASLIHLEMWAFVHGIAAMLATSFLELDVELISGMLSDIYMGLKARHLTEEK
jgi:hypothetical protein